MSKYKRYSLVSASKSGLALRTDAKQKKAKTPRVAHCRSCKEPLYQMYTHEGIYPASQCLNHKCKMYGIAQSFKTGLSTRKDATSRTPSGYTRGDPTPLIRSINKASDILRRRGIIVDTYLEMPRSGDQNYYYELVRLKKSLWAKVRSTAPKARGRK